MATPQPIAVSTPRALARLAVLTCNGREPEQVIEEALDRMPEPGQPVHGLDEYLARIAEIQEQAQRDNIPSMAEFDAREYDARGNPR